MWTGVQWTGTIPAGNAALVHLGLAERVARRLVPDADDPAARRALLPGCRRRAGKRNSMHVLDHRQRPYR